MPTRSLNVLITGDARPLATASRQASTSLDRVSTAQAKATKATNEHIGATGRLRTSFGNLYARGGEAILAVAGLEGIKKGVESVLEAYKTQQLANSALQAQMRALNITYSAHSDAIEEVVKRTSHLSGLSVPDLTKAYTELLRATGSVSQSNKLLAVTADLARAKNLDLSKAGLLVGKVAAGNTSTLSRYGIILKPVTTATDALAKSHDKVTVAQRRAAAATDKTATTQQALAELQKRFAGQAKAYGDTAAGAGDKLRSSWEEVRAELGGKLAPVLAKVEVGLARFITDAQEGKGAGGQFASTMRDLDDALKPVAHDLSVGTGWLGKHSTAMKLALNPVTNFVTEMKGLAVVLKAVEDAVRGVVSAVKSIPGLFKGAAGAVSGLVGKLNPFGDGLGRAASSLRLPTGGAFGGSLMGAQPALRPFAAIGSRFGLHVSSGRRAGAITSSGNVSFHSSGEAIDEAGTPAGMMGYFQYLKGHFGGRLAELIYGPGKVGIKNGQPFNFGPALNAQHMDHVHVAFDTGRPGVGDGPGRARGKYMGDGIGFAATAKLAESVGLPGVTFAQIAHGESDYVPTAIGHDPGGTIGYGLFQITTKYNDDIIAKYGGPHALMNPHTNALAARDVWRRQGKAAWYGTKYVTGWNLHYNGKGSGAGGGASAVRLTPGQKRARAQFGASQGAARAQAHGELGSARAEAANRALIGPGQGGYGQKVDNAELGQATARSKDNLPGLIKAMQTEVNLKRKRLKKIRKTLTRRLKPATRKALTEEATTLIGEIGDLRDTLKEYRADQAGGATTISQADKLDAGVAPDTGAADTGTTGTDTGGGAPDNSALVAALADLKASIDAQTAFATSVSNTSNFQLTKYLSDVLSGHIVGYGVVGRSFTPGTGVEVAY